MTNESNQPIDKYVFDNVELISQNNKAFQTFLGPLVSDNGSSIAQHHVL